MGYPNNLNLIFIVNNSNAILENDDDRIIKLGEVVNNFKKSIKERYEKSPYLRLFYGKQFVALKY